MKRIGCCRFGDRIARAALSPKNAFRAQSALVSFRYRILDGQGPWDIRTNLEYTASRGFFVLGRIAGRTGPRTRCPPRRLVCPAGHFVSFRLMPPNRQAARVPQAGRIAGQPAPTRGPPLVPGRHVGHGLPGVNEGPCRLDRCVIPENAHLPVTGIEEPMRHPCRHEGRVVGYTIPCRATSGKAISHTVQAPFAMGIGESSGRETPRDTASPRRDASTSSVRGTPVRRRSASRRASGSPGMRTSATPPPG